MTNDIDKQSFGEAGAQIVAANTAIPAGQYCALSFVGGGGAITTAFSAAEAPILSGTQTSITFADGYIIYTPLVIASGSSARIACPVILYKAL
jgi:hypothetical protein